ncbi:MAG: heparan-alpha-glucosaminide N-acetyltransferase domain-containing protein [Sandaracinaceae bacterium]|nr:MAG: DUF1624 domain-containing protein [Sandaracinaceae bacterium]HBQ19264.1 hypothetical protein [Myxococcales bacterium]
MSQVADVDAMAAAPAREAAEARPVAKAARWLALDLFRFCAVCLMVQGHVFSTLLDQATKSQGWYPHHSFVHGYTAPMFLFGAGLAFGYTTFRKWDEHTSGGFAALKRFKRYGWLLVIGYMLHLPTLSLSRLLDIDDPAALARMFQVDVLQHIGVSLAICQLMVLFVKSKRVFVTLVAAMAGFCICAAPWVWQWDVSGLPVWLAGYVNAAGGSIFPIVPWAGFTYTGIVIAYAVGVGGAGSAKAVSERVSWPFAALAALFLLVPVVLDRFGPFPWPEHNFWKTNPFFFFWRLGNVMAVLATLCFVERGLTRLGWLGASDGLGASVAGRLLPWVKLVGAESLIIYVAHLLALHGSVLAPGLKHTDVFAEHQHGVVMASVVTLLVFVAMVLLAKGWNELKKQQQGFGAVQISMVGLIVFLMLTGR